MTERRDKKRPVEYIKGVEYTVVESGGRREKEGRERIEDYQTFSHKFRQCIRQALKILKKPFEIFSNEEKSIFNLMQIITAMQDYEYQKAYACVFVAETHLGGSEPWFQRNRKKVAMVWNISLISW